MLIVPYPFVLTMAASWGGKEVGGWGSELFLLVEGVG